MDLFICFVGYQEIENPGYPKVGETPQYVIAHSHNAVVIHSALGIVWVRLINGHVLYRINTEFKILHGTYEQCVKCYHGWADEAKHEALIEPARTVLKED